MWLYLFIFIGNSNCLFFTFNFTVHMHAFGEFSSQLYNPLIKVSHCCFKNNNFMFYRPSILRNVLVVLVHMKQIGWFNSHQPLFPPCPGVISKMDYALQILPHGYLIWSTNSTVLDKHWLCVNTGIINLSAWRGQCTFTVSTRKTVAPILTWS